VLLVWDAPNSTWASADLGGRPTAAHRPRFDALWPVAVEPARHELSTARPDLTLEPEATVFTTSPR